jgi:hypothetical protein
LHEQNHPLSIVDEPSTFQAIAELERQQAKRRSQHGQACDADEETEAEERSAEPEL